MTLSSRDEGHFESDEKFTSQWTWYQDGKEGWMEEIRYTREKE